MRTDFHLTHSTLMCELMTISDVTFWLNWRNIVLISQNIRSLYFISNFQLGTKNTLLMWNAQTPNAVHWLLDQAMLACTFVARSNVKMNQIDHEPDTTIGFIALLNLSNWTYFSLLCAYLNKISTYCKSYPFIY